MICNRIKISIISLLVLFCVLSCAKQPKHLIKVEGSLIEVTPDVEAKTTINTIIQPYKEKVESEMNAVLSYTPVDLVRTDGAMESSLGNLLADLCMERSQPIFNSRTGQNIDFALFNYGGIRAGISKGAITNQHAFELMPFENYLVVVEMTSEKIIELIEYLIRSQRAHPVSKNISLTLMNEGFELEINGEKLNSTKNYHVLTTDYLQNLGDNMNHFSDPVSVYNLDYKMRNAIIDYLKETDTVKVEMDGRIRKMN